jgi:soluble lytic murein transglycosylase-like protein
MPAISFILQGTLRQQADHLCFGLGTHFIRSFHHFDHVRPEGRLANFVSEEQLKQEKIVQATLQKHSGIKPEQINRLTKIIVRHAQTKKLDPKLIASIIVVESRGNPTAISEAKSVGLMQVHVPTWGG